MDNTFKEYNLCDEIIRALDGIGYKKPSDVQSKVIPEIMKNNDVVVKSQTGSGKTAAFGIPLSEKVIWEESKVQALILTPTRELAIQVKDEIKNIGRFKRIRAVAVFGKQPFSEQARELKQKTHIVVGTPGRVCDHISRGTLDVSKIKYLVIDEADEMLNMGFIDQVREVINTLNKERQTMLFSATIPEEIMSLCDMYMNKPISIEIKAQKLITEKINHELYNVKEYFKLEDLNNILIKEVPETAVIFCKTKENVDKVYEDLNRKRYSINKIHGGMLQKDRMEVMEKFKRGDFRILIATDVAARGIDVEGITHVINFDLPVEKEAYVHRIGRTGRAGAKGKAISLVNQFEERLLNIIQEYIGFEIPVNEELPKEENKVKKEEAIKVLKSKPKAKKEKAKVINANITKLYFNGGKKKKLRAGDFVGAISRIEGITAEDIGIIDVQDTVSYVDILNGKGNKVLAALKDSTIKGKKLRVEKAKR
ncbi:DEAD/DEAH box helicase [Clostridium celatum]|uniref:DEAD/DEAH box helicase n=1 Tax=Clostridium celatum TaxID=36834 RepID=UPI00058D43AB|nr:DEAD/DEAH box helicase [Clostridium celatum]MDU2265617.1 DEAD/DEAH box helicase [Clostridium celatum]MDU3724310.1 DEAD/DEAH box helicase [Clostridium celatum]MDU6295473.1 DEAD/DEAH box helicase [Clostridium celatum]MDY3361129.1 DEAD/DEAH box helicase [Clostridium celatum]